MNNSNEKDRPPLETARIILNRTGNEEKPQQTNREKVSTTMPESELTLSNKQSQSPMLGWGVALLLLRLVLGGLFIFSGAAKLGFLGSYGNSPVEFATAIRKFQIVQYDLIPYLAFIIPWVEVTGGLLLLIGLSTRASSIMIKALLASFTIGMLLVIARGITIGDCSCFGGRLAAHFGVIGRFLEAPVGWTSIFRNIILIGLCLIITIKGAGIFSLDHIAATNRERNRNQTS